MTRNKLRPGRLQHKRRTSALKRHADLPRLHTYASHRRGPATIWSIANVPTDASNFAVPEQRKRMRDLSVPNGRSSQSLSIACDRHNQLYSRYTLYTRPGTMP